MHINYEIYKYRFAGGELELGGLPLKPRAALETVLIEDYLREHKFRFANARCKMDYIREYMWIPEPDGVVTVFKFGYQRHTSEDKSHWSLRKKMEFPHCVVVVSHRESSPFILIWGFEKAFKSADEVAELLGNALNSSFRGRGISINLSPCGDDAEAGHWMKYMVKTYQKAKGHKNSTDRRLKDYERLKLKKTAADFRSCVTDLDNADIIVSMIRKYMKGRLEPKDVFKPIAAAIEAKVIRRPTWPEVSSEFHLGESLESSFHRLTRDRCKTYFDSTFFDMVEKFRSI